MAGSEVLFGFDVAGAAVVAVMLDFLAGVFSSVSSSSVFTMIEQDAFFHPYSFCPTNVPVSFFYSFIPPEIS